MSRASHPRAASLCTSLSVLLLLSTAAVVARAESCKTADDMDATTRAAISSTGQRYFDMAVKGDLAKSPPECNPQPRLQLQRHRSGGHKSQVRDRGLSRNIASAVSSGGRRFKSHCACGVSLGVFNQHGQTANSAVFNLDGLPAGKYAVVILDAASSNPATVSFILQQQGNDWRLGGLYIKPAQAAGHDADWFLTHARDYKTKGQLHNAWLYYRQALILISPLSFMKTAATDKLIDESQALQPSDFPADSRTVDLPVGGVTYRLTIVFPEAVGNDLDLIVKYQASDVSDTTRTYQSNVTVIKALVAKFPELKNAFVGVVARGVEPSGRDYGTLLAMKDVK